MKPKPKPKAELIAEVRESIDPPVYPFIRITCHSRDAHEFVRDHAKEFGWIRPLLIGAYDLNVYAGYDIQEVAAYLNSYNDSEGEKS